MKKLIVFLTIIVSLVTSANAQISSGKYGPYSFVANYDKNGAEMDVKGFPEINIHVITTNFFGIPSSGAFFTYEFMGQSQMSGNYEYQGFSRGWYSYGFMGMSLLISADGEIVRISNPYGGYGEYVLE